MDDGGGRPRRARLIAALGIALSLAAVADEPRPVRWDDLLPAVQRRLAVLGGTARAFDGFRADHARRTQARLREGDLDALIYYALQSTRFTGEPPIEPAISAKSFAESLDDDQRARWLSGQTIPAARVPAAASRRLSALAAALSQPSTDSRLSIFRDVVRREPGGQSAIAWLAAEYVRVMRFLYEKEFIVAPHPDSAARVAALYRERGLSTDSAVEAGYLVSLGAGMIQAAEPARRIRRVLVVGPGFDLAPRTGLIEVGPPRSFQPYAVIDALVALGLSRLEDLVVVAGDINSRVVTSLGADRTRDVPITLMTGIGDGNTLILDEAYRHYFDQLGEATATPLAPAAVPEQYRGHLVKTLRLHPTVVRTVNAVRFDVVSERLTGAPFDLIVATNIFPYLGDVELTLALANIAAMLAPDGVLLHNEARALVGDISSEVGLPLTHSRTTTIATVRGAATPLFDRVFIHRRARPAQPPGWLRPTSRDGSR